MLNRIYRFELPRLSAWPPPRDALAAAPLLLSAKAFDPIGHWSHLALACGFLALLPSSTMPKEVLLGCLAACALVRSWHAWRTYTPLLRDPLAWLLLAWALWVVLSLAWSPDVHEGLDEIKTFRMLVIPLLLWPLAMQTPGLIAAFLAGVFASNLWQLFQWLEWFGLHPADDHRLRGMLHPSQTSLFCVAAMCWHLSAACALGGWRRWLSLALFAAATMGLLGTGARAMWLGAAVALPALSLFLIIRLPAARRIIPLMLVLAALTLAIAWPRVQGMLAGRVQSVMDELSLAEEKGVITRSTTLRLASWGWAWEIFKSSPIIGCGAGSYATELEKLPHFQEAVAREPDRKWYLARYHPHSTYLHALSCLGAIGGSLFLAILLWIGHRAWHGPRDHAYAHGTAFVALAWCIGAVFDTFTINGNALGLLAFLVFVVHPFRPARA